MAAPRKSKFGGGSQCAICQKTVYDNEKITFDGHHYHNSCFKCSVCEQKIGKVAEAGSMNGKVSHRLCFEKQMRETGGKYGGEKVVVGGKVNQGPGAVSNDGGDAAADE
eukprot:gb/GEZN01031746.1/.p1 GENE.gb/GEZN01031746.1/~~gb/GEZN01031746.1/.p1  ORF type:complete len:109 (+),score=23.50 gb/GEZN01031746.1/:29-355(+)